MNDWTKIELEKKLGSIELAITIPVNLRIEGKQTILDLTEMEKILREARLISIGNCGCREKLHKCNAPLDVCFGLNSEAEEAVKKGLARKANLTEALNAPERSHEAGLVHVTYTFKGKEKPEVICSCCSCCCHSLSALVRFGMPSTVVASQYIAEPNYETCINCGKCVTRCQFNARRLEKDELRYDETRCFGCGLCVSTCPTGSISLRPRNPVRLDRYRQIRNNAQANRSILPHRFDSAHARAEDNNHCDSNRLHLSSRGPSTRAVSRPRLQ